MPARTITHDGLTLTIHQWAARTHQSPQMLRYRLNAGWSIERALSAPPTYRGRKRMPNAEQRAMLAALNADARALRRDFYQLVREIDRSLSSFASRLELLVENATPGVSNDFAASACDRGPPVAQDGV